MTRWINLYPPCDTERQHPWRTTSWVSRALADQHAKPGRIACVEVSFNAGDGLQGRREPMTPAAAKAFLDKLVDEHLSFNGNVEWRSGATEALVALANKTAVIETALEDAGLIAVWLGKDKVQIVCRPGRFEHARAALGLEEAPK